MQLWCGIRWVWRVCVKAPSYLIVVEWLEWAMTCHLKDQLDLLLVLVQLIWFERNKEIRGEERKHAAEVASRPRGYLAAFHDAKEGDVAGVVLLGKSAVSGTIVQGVVQHVCGSVNWLPPPEGVFIRHCNVWE